MEKVLTGVVLRACIIDTTIEESIPPERNAPRGTSAVIRSLTDSLKRASNWAIASSSDSWNGLATEFVATCLADQYEVNLGSVSLVATSKDRIVAGGSL